MTGAEQVDHPACCDCVGAAGRRLGDRVHLGSLDLIEDLTGLLEPSTGDVFGHTTTIVGSCFGLEAVR